VATPDFPTPDSDQPFEEERHGARLRLRRVLTDRVGGVDDLVWYLDRALPDFDRNPEARVAVEELVDHLGRLLGFDSDHDELLACSVWSSPAGARVAVIIEQAHDARSRIGPLARALDALLASLPVASSRDVSALCVLCGQGDPADAEAAVTVRRATDRCRLTTLAALLALAKLVESRNLAHEDAVLVLRPSRPLADPVVQLLERTLGTKTAKNRIQTTDAG
jgi:hypothetical protein